MVFSRQDAVIYGGSNMGNLGGVISQEVESHGQSQSAELTLPPLSIIVFKAETPLVQEIPKVESLPSEPKK